MVEEPHFVDEGEGRLWEDCCIAGLEDGAENSPVHRLEYVSPDVRGDRAVVEKSSAVDIYLTLRSLVVGRVSYKELNGPLGIAGAAYQVAQQGWIPMLLFLGFLSVNLAVLNFLPIPVLDGGHMIFLIWEAVTGRRPSDRVMIAATYVGFAFLLSLMFLVIYLDVFVHPFAKK